MTLNWQVEQELHRKEATLQQEELKITEQQEHQREEAQLWLEQEHQRDKAGICMDQTSERRGCFSRMASLYSCIFIPLGIMIAAAGSAFKILIKIRRPKQRYMLTEEAYQTVLLLDNHLCSSEQGDLLMCTLVLNILCWSRIMAPFYTQIGVTLVVDWQKASTAPIKMNKLPIITIKISKFAL